MKYTIPVGPESQSNGERTKKFPEGPAFFAVRIFGSRFGSTTNFADATRPLCPPLPDAQLSPQLLRVSGRALAGVLDTDVGGGLAVACRPLGEERDEPGGLLVFLGAARDNLVGEVGRV